MDRKSIILLVVCFVLLMLWYPVMNKLIPPTPVARLGTNAPALMSEATNFEPVPGPGPTSAEVAEVRRALPSPFTNTNVAEVLLEATNENARYTFTSYGGGLKFIELLQYPETVSSRLEKAASSPGVATLNTGATVPTLAVLAGSATLGDGVFTLSRTTNGVRAEKLLTNGLDVIKEFDLSSNYIVAARVWLQNRSSQPLNLPAQQWVVGTATALGARDNGSAVGVLWYDGAKSSEAGANYFSSRGIGCLPRTPPTEYRGGASNVVWVAAHNQFFTLAAMPQEAAQEVDVYPVMLPRSVTDGAATNAPPQQGYEAALVYPALTLAPMATFERGVYLYAGPKEYQTLARIAARFNNNIDLVMGYGGFIGFFSKSLLLAMNFVHRAMSLPYGWAIVAITVIIKVLYWPLTQASTRSMKRLQALQPQMNAIKEKYKDDQLKANQKVMEFMKENKVNPMGGCLPSVLQIPVFWGFYRMIQSAIELRGARFLWIADLSKPDTLLIIPSLGVIPVFGIPGVGLPVNLMPLIMGGTMLWQSHITPPSAGMDPAQAKMMRYMPLIFLLFLYNFSSGLTLYWTVSNLLTILQTKLTPAIPQAGPAAAVAKPTAPRKGSVLTQQAKKRK